VEEQWSRGISSGGDGLHDDHERMDEIMNEADGDGNFGDLEKYEDVLDRIQEIKDELYELGCDLQKENIGEEYFQDILRRLQGDYTTPIVAVVDIPDSSTAHVVAQAGGVQVENILGAVVDIPNSSTAHVVAQAEGDKVENSPGAVVDIPDSSAAYVVDL